MFASTTLSSNIGTHGVAVVSHAVGVRFYNTFFKHWDPCCLYNGLLQCPLHVTFSVCEEEATPPPPCTPPLTKK